MSESERRITVQTVPERPAEIEVTISVGTKDEIVAQNRLGYADMATALTDLPRAAREFAARSALSFLSGLTAESFERESE